MIRVLPPISFRFALVLVGLGEEAIKELGTNGGGVFNANSAHPFENRGRWSDLIEIVEIANDIARYFAILPAMFGTVYLGLNKLSIMHLVAPQSAILSAVIFNTLITVALIPLTLRGVRYRPASTSSLLRRTLLVYGLSGVVSPFVFIWLIDLIIRHIPGIG